MSIEDSTLEDRIAELPFAVHLPGDPARRQQPTDQFGAWLNARRQHGFRPFSGVDQAGGDYLNINSALVRGARISNRR